MEAAGNIEGTATIAVTGNIGSTRNIAHILNLQWSCGSIRISGHPVPAGAPALTDTQMLPAHDEAVGRLTATRVTEGAPQPHPGYRAAVTRVEPGDLARLEGEGGREAPELAARYPEESRKETGRFFRDQ